MKYCGNCGTKLKEDSNFCTKCGHPTSLGIKKIKETRQRKNEEKNQNLILKTGIALIVIASIIFTLFSFKNISDLFKVIFLGVESIVFIYISILFKKKTKYGYKALWAIGVLIIPIVLILLTSDNLLGSIAFMNNAGLYIYLAISFLICIVIYIISYRFIKSKAYLYLSYIFMNAFIVSGISTIYELTTFNSYICNNILFTSLLSFNFVVLIILLVIKKDTILKTFINYLRIFLMLISIFIIYLYNYNYDASIIYPSFNLFIYNIINTIIYLVSIYIVIIKTKGSKLNILMPIFITLISVLFVNDILSDYNNISIFMSISVILLQLFISYLIENKYFKVSTYIVIIISLAIILAVSLNYGYILSFICFMLVLLSSIFIYKMECNTSYKRIISIAIMLCIYFVIYSLIKSITLTKNGYICLITSVIYSLIYVILKTKNVGIYKSYEFLSYFFIIISSLSLDNYNMGILNEIIWIYYFTLKLLFDDKVDIRNFLLTGAIINLFIVLIRFNVELYYILLSFSVLFIFISILASKVKKINKDVFNIIAIIMVALASLFDFKDYEIMGICINILLYCFVYWRTIKNKNIDFIFRFIYTLIGFSIIYKIFGYFIDVVVISSLLSFITFLIIIITMYLMRVEEDKKIVCYSLVTLYPYIVLVMNIDLISNYNLEFILTPIIIYIFLFSEKVIIFKDNSLKHIFQILLLSIIHVILLLSLHNDTGIYSLLLSVIYVIYGILRKDSPFVTFGCITLLLTTILLFFEVSNSLGLVFSILFIGVSLITYISIKESKK